MAWDQEKVAAAMRKSIVQQNTFAAIYSGGAGSNTGQGYYHGSGGVGVSSYRGTPVPPPQEPDTQRSHPSETDALKKRVTDLEKSNVELSMSLINLERQVKVLSDTLNTALSTARRGGVGYWEEG